MRRRIPSLVALEMFESSARHQSFARAAEELSITHSAVSRQVAALEDRVGVPLFVRNKQRILLTEHGRRYAARIHDSLDRIERDTLELMARGGRGQTLEVAVTPTLASSWLIPRLPQFRVLHPDITINLAIRNRRFLFEEEPFDAAIHFGAMQWPGVQGFELLPEGDLAPVCAPSLLGARRSLRPEQVARLPLLHLATRVDAWREWFQATGMDGDLSSVNGARYEMFSLLASAAVSGLGVALVARQLIENELADGRLVVVCRRTLPGRLAYHVAYPLGRPVGPGLQAFLQWLSGLTRAQIGAH
jgi:DNA-binding transcriptional LysR family regulator